MNLLRDAPVDIRKYLPEYLTKDEEMNTELQADSNEHERMRNAIAGIFDQFFIETATWGLADWERILDLQPSLKDDFAQRRNRILLKLRSHQTSTPKFMADLVKRYCTATTAVGVQEENPKNMFHIICHDGTVIYTDDLIDAIETYKPAHLAYDIIMHYVLDIQEDAAIRIGIMGCRFGKKKIEIRHPPDSNIAGCAGVCYMRAGRMTIGAGQVPPPSPMATMTGIMIIRVGKARIPADESDIGKSYVNRLYPAGVKEYVGTKQFRYGIKTIQIAKPAPADSMQYVGIASGIVGHKRIDTAAPTETVATTNAGTVMIRVGRIRIDVFDSDTI